MAQRLTIARILALRVVLLQVDAALLRSTTRRGTGALTAASRRQNLVNGDLLGCAAR